LTVGQNINKLKLKLKHYFSNKFSKIAKCWGLFSLNAP